MNRPTRPRILECTLRDGSYAIDFQFSADDTRCLAKALEDLGFDMIEVGHGMGLGASEKGKGVAAATDEGYLAAAAAVIQRADWGMFCIPGIAELRHLDMAAEYGMRFVRVGTNIEAYAEAEPFIARAKHHGMFVCANFMKSYVSTPADFARYALAAERFGADLVYIVDSAGGMFPEQIADYVDAVRSRSQSLRLGFHGHHNLGLGLANAVKAIELGVEVVDASLQGLGRSAGNTSTEQLLCVLLRKGIDLGIDVVDVLDVAERYVQPLGRTPGFDSLDVVAGLALFHSSYMPTIQKYATAYRVDPRRLILAVCKHDRVNAPVELVEREARLLAEQGVRGTWRPSYRQAPGGEQEP